jgi:hypothetical protein
MTICYRKEEGVQNHNKNITIEELEIGRRGLKTQDDHHDKKTKNTRKLLSPKVGNIRMSSKP